MSMIKACREHQQKKLRAYDMLATLVQQQRSFRQSEAPFPLAVLAPVSYTHKDASNVKDTARIAIRRRHHSLAPEGPCHFFVSWMNTIVSSYRKDIATPRMMGL